MARPKRELFYMQNSCTMAEWVKEYHNNSRIVMEYLLSNEIKTTAYYSSIKCLEQLKAYLLEKEEIYSHSKAIEWLSKLQPDQKPHYLITVKRLNEVYESGSVKKYGLHTLNFPAYSKLDNVWKTALDNYLETLCFNERTINQTRFVLARFFYKAQLKNILPYEIDYNFIDEYISEEKRKRGFEHLENFLSFLSSLWNISPILKWYPHLRIHNRSVTKELLTQEHTERINAIVSKKTVIELHTVYEKAIEFTEKIRMLGYSKTVIKEARYTMHSLLVFLDKNSYPYHPDIAAIWLEVQKTNFRQTESKGLRRILCLFDSFLKDGIISPERIYKFKGLLSDSLPEWCKIELYTFLNLKIKEGWCKSTINMYRSSVTRFCFSLVKQGISSFSEITHETIHVFNTNDMHETAEGKNAYNCRIRNFLKYLERKEIISDNIHIALYSAYQKGEKIVTTLTDNEKHKLAERLSNASTEIELRNRAIILIGLRMGLRSCDIVKIRISDIDWQKQTIKIVQKKTLYEMELPMPTEVGNAIYLYLKCRTSNSEYLFAKNKMPFNNVCKQVCNTALSSVLPERNVKGSGFHVTRRTFATDQLKSSVKQNTIKDLLGHRDGDQLMKYLNLDSERMFLCPLSLEETNICMEVKRYD